MSRRYVVNPHNAWQEYFDTKKEWTTTSKSFWYFVSLRGLEEKVCKSNLRAGDPFFDQNDRFRKYYCFLHHEYPIIYEE